MRRTQALKYVVAGDVLSRRRAGWGRPPQGALGGMSRFWDSANARRHLRANTYFRCDAGGARGFGRLDCEGKSIARPARWAEWRNYEVALQPLLRTTPYEGGRRLVRMGRRSDPPADRRAGRRNSEISRRHISGNTPHATAPAWNRAAIGPSWGQISPTGHFGAQRALGAYSPGHF